MGIEPTSGLFPGRTTVLKTAAGTSPANRHPNSDHGNRTGFIASRGPEIGIVEFVAAIFADWQSRRLDDDSVHLLSSRPDSRNTALGSFQHVAAVSKTPARSVQPFGLCDTRVCEKSVSKRKRVAVGDCPCFIERERTRSSSVAAYVQAEGYRGFDG